MMRLLTLLLVFLSLSFSVAQDQQRSGKYVRIELVGKSGQIRVFPANNTKGDVFTQLKWNKLEEWDSNGQKVQSVNNFASQQVSWGAPYATSVQGNDAIATTLTGTVNVGNGQNGIDVPLNITVFLFNRTVTVQNGNTTVDVDMNSIKFNVEMAGWPFKSVNNTLAFGVTLTSGGGKPQAQDNSQGDVPAGSGPKPSRAQKVQFGPGSLVSPKNALIDGVDSNITIIYDGNRNLVWQFPYFNKTLKYDPTLGTDVTTPSDSSTAVDSSTGPSTGTGTGTGTGSGKNAGALTYPSVFLLIVVAFCTYVVRA